mgnify:FL=1|jgi:hypothetical protein
MNLLRNPPDQDTKRLMVVSAIFVVTLILFFPIYYKVLPYFNISGQNGINITMPFCFALAVVLVLMSMRMLKK